MVELQKHESASMEPQLGAIAENIAFLALLKHGGQAKTYRESLRPYGSDKDIHSFTFKHETIIAKAFALILVNTNDKSKVGAVCIEERVDRNGMILRSATNSGSQQERQLAFDRIAEFLKHSSDSRRHREQHNDLLFEIICVCQKKILGRLRSRHARQTYKTKPPLLHKLQHVLDTLQRYDYRGRLGPDLEKKADVVIDRLEALERLQRVQALGREGSDCIQGILLGVRILLPVLESWARSSTMEAESLQHAEYLALENVIVRLRKLDQYQYAAVNLMRLTRRYRILRNVQFEAVTMHDCPKDRNSMDLSPSDRGLFSQFHTKQHIDHERPPPSSPCTPKAYQKIVTVARQESRVHAEIQLLCFYESMESCSGIIRPRAICSEKHAYFLCDIFIRAHAQFYMPSTHGTFYSRWRLPKPGEFKMSSTKIMATLHRFNAYLEEEIKDRLLQGPQRYLSVPESVLIEAEEFTPSALSSVYAHDQAHTFGDVPGVGELSQVPTINKDEICSDAELSQNDQSKLASVSTTTSPAHPFETLSLRSVEGTVNSVLNNPTVGRVTGRPTYENLGTGLLEPSSSLSLNAGKKQCSEDESATYISNRRSATDSDRPNSSTSTKPALDHTTKNHFFVRQAQGEQVAPKIFPGQNLTICLPYGCTMQVHTPYIHLHLEYASVASRSNKEVRSDLVLRLCCAVKDMDISDDAYLPSTCVDLGTRGDSLPMALPENTLFGEEGVTLCKHDQLVILRAVDK